MVNKLVQSGASFLGRGVYRSVKMTVSALVGGLAVLTIFFVVQLNQRPDLQIWHTADLDQEFTQDADIDNFEQYLQLESRLFEQLNALVYAETPIKQQSLINRFTRNSLSDPERWSPNWNRSFILSATAPRAGVLLLHGMSDSPYSLRNIGETLNEAGSYVVGLRLPGHGTAPSGLVELRWQDMVKAVELAVRYTKEQIGDAPLYIVGYSNGATLGIHYALSAIDDRDLPSIQRLVLISPAIGVTPAAAFATWQARLGHLLGLEKLAWNDIKPEYDPFKYASFAVNAGDVVYQLTNEIKRGLSNAQSRGKLNEFPPVLSFCSVVDATSSTTAVITDFYDHLADRENELVLFDINRSADIAPAIDWAASPAIERVLHNPSRNFSTTIVSNQLEKTTSVSAIQRIPGSKTAQIQTPQLFWPPGIFSLSHVALPFPPSDPLYGGLPSTPSPGISLGNVALRGEHNVLQIPPADMLRLRWNPFYSVMQTKIDDFLFGQARAPDNSQH